MFSEFHDIEIHDPPKGMVVPQGWDFDLMLVAMPYSDAFVETVERYRRSYPVKSIIIFSTVQVGITSQIPGAVHSPVEGKHPHLAESIQLMPRWVGGYNKWADKFFNTANVKPVYLKRPEFTEFLKLRSTSKYGINIEWTRYEKRVADEIGMPFEFVRMFDKHYNELYNALGMPQFQRYILTPPEGLISGHCVRQNAMLLHEQFPSVFLDMVIDGKGDAACLR